MHILAHIAILVALIPGSLLFLAVVVWRIARNAVGFEKPSLPLRTTDGVIVYTEDDWHHDAKGEYPFRYAVFEELPRRIKRLGRNLIRPFRPRTVRESLLFKAFGVFCDWFEACGGVQDLPVFEEDQGEGLLSRYNARMAEIRELYDWWKVKRPAHVRRIEEQSVEHREFNMLDLELDDQHNLARLANIWRDLT